MTTKIISVIDSTDLYGKERANIEVARSMRDRGAQVEMLINENANSAVREELSDYDTVEMPFPRELQGRWRGVKYIFAWLRLIVRMISYLRHSTADYILIPTEITLSYLYLPFMMSNIKVVFRCGDSPLVFRKHGLVRNIYAGIWRHFIMPRIEHVVCNAKFLKNQMEQSGRMWTENDRVIYNFPPSRKKVDDSTVYTDNGYRLKVGFLGRIVADKGVIELIEAVLKVNETGKNVEVFIGGDVHVDEAYTASVMKVLYEHGNSGNAIKFIGKVNDLDKFYAHIDLVIIPSIYPEPMANVLTEAKYHHKAAILFNLGGMPEIVSHQEDGYICNEVTVDSLAEGILYYANNPNIAAKHGENAYLSIGRLGLTRDVFINKWEAVFAESRFLVN